MADAELLESARNSSDGSSASGDGGCTVEYA
jgi:hypothetical protein